MLKNFDKMLVVFVFLSVIHISGQTNQIVRSLARFSLRIDSDLIWSNEIPSFFVSIVLEDSL